MGALGEVIGALSVVVPIVTYVAFREYFVTRKLLERYPQTTWSDLIDINEPVIDPLFLPYARESGRRLAWIRHHRELEKAEAGA